MDWISVDTAHPADDNAVAVTDGVHSTSAVWFPEDGMWWTEDGKPYSDGTDVKWWTPLPPPPGETTNYE